MIVVKEYSNAKTAPVGNFICPNCQNTVVRKLSKVKNPDKVFCDNICRAKYTERLRIEFNVDENDFKSEVDAMNGLIKLSYKNFGCYNAGLMFDEYKQLCMISIFKNYKRANNGEGSKLSFYYKVFRHTFMNWLKERCVFESIDDYHFQISAAPEEIAIINEEIKAIRQKKATSIKILLDHSFGLSMAELTKKYKMDERGITTNIYNARKMLKEKEEL